MDGPDYEIAEMLRVSSAEQHRALGNVTRGRILGLLLDRASDGDVLRAVAAYNGGPGALLRAEQL